MSDNENDNKENRRPELTSEQKAHLEASKKSVEAFLKDMTFFMMNQVSFIVEDGEIHINVFVKNRLLHGFEYTVQSKRTYLKEKKDA